MHRPKRERSCRECGCTQAEACAGGCRWVEADLCSACAPWPYLSCHVCNKPAPDSIEAGIEAGWHLDGFCPTCERELARRLPKGASQQ